MELTQAQLKEQINYDKDTGIFTWNYSTSMKKAGAEVGYICKNYGYKLIRINTNKKSYLARAHRLAWLYIYGYTPKEHIDHINHDRADNRIVNLREVNNRANHKNKKMNPRNKSGYNGVHYNKRDERWVAQITSGDKIIHLGVFKSKADAIETRKEADIIYGYHTNHGKDKR